MRNATGILMAIAVACCLSIPQEASADVGAPPYLGPGAYELIGEPISYTLPDGIGVEMLSMSVQPGPAVLDLGGEPFAVDSFFDVFTMIDFSSSGAGGPGAGASGAGEPGGGEMFFVESFFDVFTELSVDGGESWTAHLPEVPVIVGIRPIEPMAPSGSSAGLFDTEIVSMSLSGDVGGIPVEIRQSPDLPSLGQTTVTRVGDGRYTIDSFFDVFTELRVEGAPGVASVAPGQLEFVPNSGGLREDCFEGELRPDVGVIGGGTGWNNGEWIRYDEAEPDRFPWWNQWFYNDPLDPERQKEITWELELIPLDPSGDADWVEVALNWSNEQYPNGLGRPPMANEEDFIERFTIFEGPVDEVKFLESEQLFLIPDYNPEWISIDIRYIDPVTAEGVLITGCIWHECIEPVDPPELTWDGTDPGPWISAHWLPGPVVPGGLEDMVVNSGTSVVSTDQTLLPAASLEIGVDASGAGGTVRVAPSGVLLVLGPTRVLAGGTLVADGPVICPSVEIDGGLLTNSPGGAADIKVEGDVAIGNDGRLAVEWVGLSVDHLNAVGTGVVTLGPAALLEIAPPPAGAAAPPIGHTAPLITANGGLAGMFDRINGVLFGDDGTGGPDKAFAVTYQANGATVTIARPGDFDLDKTVGFSDFTYLAAKYGQSGMSWVDGDCDGSGDVTFGDFTYLAAFYGTTDPDSPPAPAPASGAVELVVDVTTGEMWLRGNAATLSGYNILSASGSLIPDGDGTATPFQFYLSNLAADVSAASLGVGVGVNGDVALDPAYDTAGTMDLTFSYGVFGQGGSVSGNIVTIPEPTTMALLALGALGVLRRRRRR